AGEHPGGAGLGPRLGVLARFEAHGHVEGLAGAAGPLAVGADLGEELGVVGWGGDPGREQAVPPRRAAHRAPVRPFRGDPDRDPGLLYRDRLEVAGPVPGQLCEALVQQYGPFARVGDLAERLELVVAGAADAHAEGEPARAELIQGDRLP